VPLCAIISPRFVPQKNQDFEVQMGYKTAVKIENYRKVSKNKKPVKMLIFKHFNWFGL